MKIEGLLESEMNLYHYQIVILICIFVHVKLTQRDGSAVHKNLPQILEDISPRQSLVSVGYAGHAAIKYLGARQISTSCWWSPA